MNETRSNVSACRRSEKEHIVRGKFNKKVKQNKGPESSNGEKTERVDYKVK